MSDKRVVTLSKEEVDDIEMHHERITSLQDLVKTMEESSEGETSSLYEKMLLDYAETKKAIERWWDNSIEKYNLQCYPADHLYVNFIERCIFLKE